MKSNHNNRRLPVFWLSGTVLSYPNGTGGSAIVLDIKEVYGRRNDEHAKVLIGSAASFQKENDPRKNSIKSASDVILDAPTNIDGDPTEPARIMYDKPNKHQFAEGEQEVACFVEFDPEKAAGIDPTVGIRIIAWCHKHIFDPLMKSMRSHNSKLFHNERERRELAEKRRNVPFQIFEMGVEPGAKGVKPIITLLLGSLAEFFEYRPWPKNIQWATIVDRHWTVIKGEPGQLPAPKHIQKERPILNNPRMDALYDTVKDLPPCTAHAQEEPEHNYQLTLVENRFEVPLPELDKVILEMPKPAPEKTVSSKRERKGKPANKVA